MAARAVWRGIIRMGRTEVPVKMFSVIERSQSVHFRLLHEPDMTPVQGRMVNPSTGDAVPSEETRRGYATETGEMVMFETEELDALEPEASRDIEILRFVPTAAMDPAWYDHPYYLGPDAELGPHAALVAAMKSQEVEGIARWVMWKKHYVGSLRVEGSHLMLVTLHRAGEVISVSALPRPEGRALEAKEIQMAKQLLHALEGEFKPSEWKDEHRERLLELIEAKAKGKTISINKLRKTEDETDLAAALEQSLAAVKKSA